MVEKIKSVYLLAGGEGFLKQRVLDKIKSAVLSPMTEDLNYNLFYGRDAQGPAIIDCIATLPFMAKKRLVVVKDVDQLPPSHKESLISYCRSPRETTCLVLESGQINLEREFYRSIAGGGGKVMSFRPLSDSEIPGWIRDRVKDLGGKKIAQQAVDILKDNIGNDLRFLSLAIEKLISYVGDRDSITGKDTEAVVGRTVADTAFELIEAIAQKRASNALSILSSLLREGKKASEITGLIGWQLRRIWRAKELLSEGNSKDKIAKELRINRHFLDKFIKQVRAFQAQKLKEDFQILLEADLDIKTGHLREKVILELLIIRLCR